MQAAAKDSAAIASGSNAAAAQQPRARAPGKPQDTPVVSEEASRKKAEKGKEEKHKAGPQNEIDALFDATLGKKVKRAGLAREGNEADAGNGLLEKGAKEKHKSKSKGQDGDLSKKKSKKRKDREEGATDKELDDVLGAIRSAPKEDKGHKKRKRAH